MKTLLQKFFFITLLAITTINIGFAQKKIAIDKVEENGARMIGTEQYRIYLKRGGQAFMGLGVVIDTAGCQSYVLMLKIYEQNKKYTFEIGRKLLLKCENGDIITLENTVKRGPADYENAISQYGTFYYVNPAYKITKEEILAISQGNVTKIRVETDIDEFDNEIKKNKLSKNITLLYNTLQEVLAEKKDIYTDF